MVFGPAQNLIERIGCVAGNRYPLGHGAQPGDLAFGELAGGEDAPVAQFGELAAVTQRRDSITAQLSNVRQMLATLGGGAVLAAVDPEPQPEPEAEAPADEAPADEELSGE